jgi:hypothetical protein
MSFFEDDWWSEDVAEFMVGKLRIRRVAESVVIQCPPKLVYSRFNIKHPHITNTTIFLRKAPPTILLPYCGLHKFCSERHGQLQSSWPVSNKLTLPCAGRKRGRLPHGG